MTHILLEDYIEAVILVDASNAFSGLIRQVILLNCNAICPTLFPILINTRNESNLFVDGQCLLSKDGTTQGDRLSMTMYAIATQPIIRRLDGIAKQITTSSLAGLMNILGPIYGYLDYFQDSYLDQT